MGVLKLCCMIVGDRIARSDRELHAAGQRLPLSKHVERSLRNLCSAELHHIYSVAT